MKNIDQSITQMTKDRWKKMQSEKLTRVSSDATTIKHIDQIAEKTYVLRFTKHVSDL